MYIQWRRDIHERDLRDSEDFRLPLFRNGSSQKMLFYNGLKQFNELPKDIKCERVILTNL